MALNIRSQAESLQSGGRQADDDRMYEPVTEGLLSELRASRTDLARLVERLVGDGRSLVYVAAEAVRAWDQRAPESWAKVKAWLAARGVTVVCFSDREGIVSVGDAMPPGRRSDQSRDERVVL